MRTLGVIAWLLLLAACGGPPAPQVMLGPVTADSAVIWLNAVSDSVSARFVDASMPAAVRWQEGREIYSQGPVRHLQLAPLLPGHIYRYQIYNPGSGKVSAEHQLQAAALPASGNLDVFLGSCAYLSSWPLEHKPIFESLARHAQQNQTEQLMLWLGDNLYYRPDDFASANNMQARYQKQRAFPGIAALLPSMPNYAIWDDWDYGGNDSDRHFVGRKDSRAVFRAMWPTPTGRMGDASGQGMYYRFKRGDVEFFMLDDRTYRDADVSPVRPDKTMFGGQQIHWLQQGLLDSRARYKVIASGSALLNGLAGNEGWHNFQRERLAFFSWLMQQNIVAVTALEIIREQTPDAMDNSALGDFAKRFNHPTDGLPVEVLEVATPVIRSYVSRTYHFGWFELDSDHGNTLAFEASAWVTFRNKKPAHGVLSKADIDEWAPKLTVLLRRCLACFGNTLPRIVDADTLKVNIGSSDLTLTTPLLRAGMPVVISGVATRKGIWKLEGQTLAWDKSDSFTVDLPEGSVFEELESNFPSKFDVVELEFEGSKHSVFSNVPVRQTSTFEGRSKELEALTEWMNEPDESRFCLIFGDGGIGKTTLALEFLNRILDGDEVLAARPPSIISYYSAKMTRWSDQGVTHLQGISDAMEDCVRELLFCLYPVLGKEYYKLTDKALVDRVATEFTQQGFMRNDILLVLDNTETLATSPSEVERFSTFLKQIGRRLGRVLITSRRREFVAFEPLQISALSDEECTVHLRMAIENGSSLDTL